MRLLSKSVAAVAVAVLVIAFNAQPAGAVGGGTVVLTGSVSPDPVLASFNSPGGTFAISRSMGGTGFFVEDDVVAFQCAIAYNTTGTTNLVVGVGTGALTCSGALSIGCSVEYTQIGSREHITGECSRPALGAARIDGDCVVGYLMTTVAMLCEFTFI